MTEDWRNRITVNPKILAGKPIIKGTRISVELILDLLARKTEDYRFSLQDLRKMYDVADLQEKYILMAGKSLALRSSDFLRLKRGDFEPYLDRPVPISIGEITTQKERTKAYPFIDSDAKIVIKLMLQKMDREGTTKPNDRVLTFSDEIQLSRVVKRLTEKAGIKTGNKQVRFHNLRKFLIDRISRFMSESKWKQIVGKKISDGAYVSGEDLREDYLRAMAETCFTKLVGEGDVQNIVKKQVLIELTKNMGITEQQITTMFALKNAKTTSKQIKTLRSLIAQKRRGTQTNGGQIDCTFEHSFK
jgi:uncharacterized protein (DUF433 family)